LIAAGPLAPPKGVSRKVALFVGIDVSGSFRATGHYPDALKFLAALYPWPFAWLWGSRNPSKRFLWDRLAGITGKKQSPSDPLKISKTKRSKKLKPT